MTRDELVSALESAKQILYQHKESRNETYNRVLAGFRDMNGGTNAACDFESAKNHADIWNDAINSAAEEVRRLQDKLQSFDKMQSSLPKETTIFPQQTTTYQTNIETDSDREARIEAKLFEAELQRREQKRIAEEKAAEQKIRQEQERIAEEQAVEYKIKTITHDQNALARIAQNSYDSEVLRLAAIKILTDRDVLARIAQNIYNSEVIRITAIQKLTDENILTRIAKNIYNPRVVCMEANKRLAEI